MYNIFVYIEENDDRIRDVSLELISHAKKMTENTEGQVCAVFAGSHLKEVIKEDITKYGADKIYFIKNEKLSSYNELYFSHSIVEMINEKKPDVMLFGATKRGRSLAPRVSSSLKTGLTADCTGLELVEKNGEIKLASTRPTFGGSLMATILCKKTPQMATVREHIFKKEERVIKNTVVEEFFPNLEMPESSLKVLDFVFDKEKNTDNFSGAEVILSGGLGLGNKENFEKLKKLSSLMGGAYGATRAAVDRGYVSKERQIGQTGKNVAPKIYIAFGISGAIQHLCGIENSDYIIAINNDKDAPIFQNCDLGIVGDASEIIDELLLVLDKTHE